MRIEGSGPILPAEPRAVPQHRGAAFPDVATPAVLPPAAAASLAAMTRPATSVDMLLALAEVEEPRQEPIERRRRAAAAADRGLSLLERLRDALATGAVPPERLRELAAWADGFTPPDDPVLAGIAREIELRVRVEVAKAERD